MRIMMLALALTTSTSANAARWETLFDGKSLAALRGYQRQEVCTESWAVENGTLRSLDGKPCDLITRKVYGDFELKLEWRTEPGGNSGVFYRGNEANKWIWESAPEMQILDDLKHLNARKGKNSAGAFYDVLEPTNKKLMLVGQWNRLRIVAKGSRVQHWLNGRKVADYDLASAGIAERIANSKFAKFPEFGKLSKGHIGIQNYGAGVSFRNIRVRSLD